MTAKNVPGAPDSTQRLEEAAELCEQGHRLFSEELVQVRFSHPLFCWLGRAWEEGRVRLRLRLRLRLGLRLRLRLELP